MSRIPLLASSLLIAGSLSATAQTLVDTELLLLIDISGSVSTSEYELMMKGYANAFRQTSVLDAIATGAEGKIAVGLAFWSGQAQQSIAIDFTEVGNASQAAAFATQIEGTLNQRPYNNLTAAGSAIAWGSGLFGTETGGQQDNAFTSSFQVIDISGDGTDNDTANIGNRTRNETVAYLSEQALANGVDTINGLPIGSSSLETYYADLLIGSRADSGLTAFTQRATSFNDFEDALVRKLKREISDAGNATNGVPEPSGAALLGITALFSMARRRR